MFPPKKEDRADRTVRLQLAAIPKWRRPLSALRPSLSAGVLNHL